MALVVKELLSPVGTQFTADGTFTFPSGVTKVRAFLWGGGGKNGTQVGGGQGGAGAYVAVDIPKGNRTSLTIYLNKGGGGAGPISAGGFGGGYSAVYTATDGYIAIAGGGGGSGGGYWGGGGGFYNGSQGGNNSQPGTISTANNYSHAGGGSQSAGGAAGVSPFNTGFINGTPGSSLTGGNAGGSGYGGGGGGGYFGGGGGGGDANVSPYTGMGAGGGGSSYISAVASLVEGQAGPNGASGGVNPGGRTTGYYLAPYGASNQNGLVVIVPFLPTQQVPPQIKMGTLQPNNISGLSFWLDAADLSTITLSGSSVTTWRDKSGNGYNATQVTLASAPSFSGNQITFSNNAYLDFPQAAINNTSVYSIFLVFYPIASVNWILAKQFNGVGSYNMLSMTNYWQNNTGVTNYIYWAPWANTYTANSAAAFTLNTLQLLELLYDGLTLYIYRNGQLLTTASNGSALNILNVTNATNCTIGSWRPDGSIQNSGVTNFRMGELVYYNRFFSTSQRQQLESYFSFKWNLGFNTFSTAIPSIIFVQNTIINPTTQIFTFTGANQTFTIPSGKNLCYVYLWGAGGGGNATGTGGAGAMVQGIVRNLGGTTLTIVVGAGGIIATGNPYGGGGAGTAPGNGTSGQGGGRSAIVIGGVDYVTAGGGGGCGYSSGKGGNATFSGTAVSGQNGNVAPISYGGGGGSQSAGGAGGTGSVGTGGTGTQYTGGNGVGTGAIGGGGGGGGYYGGGGAGGGGSLAGSSDSGGGGGGGSSYTNNLQLLPGQSVLGFNSPDGYTAPNTSSPYYSGTVARGGIPSSTAGGNGLVVIIY